ncbi:hypothetical protein MOO45_02865 [Bombilactobacillus folatiphilus]|uniref:Uncharacterized protein n=1 Tax=Bombilactobacillus folatiphilus TaxID=2923362 RepID=A0ABY4PAP1_9LACO|nr:hypothetical protein [Bombilactobacillus folatiphilus]UQS82606.1 hypothetical protein MOO45_02865 [Bombilactobacillus folatiphilus]
MVQKSPEQDIFDYFYSFSLKNQYKTYDYLPAKENNAPYPFVYVGNVQGVSGGSKTALNGSVVIDIDVWGNQKQRLTVSTMVDRFFHAAIGRIDGLNYVFYGKVQDQSKQIRVDTSVPNTVLVRGMLNLRLQILGVI